METIDLKELLDYFKTKISIIILVTMVAGILGCIYGLFIQVPKYQSSASIVLVSETSMNNTEVMMNQNLVGTYSEIIKSKKVLNQVIENLDLDYDYRKISNSISVNSGTNTQIIKITVTDENSKIAMEIANETAEVFVKEVPELYNISNVNILDTAEEPEASYNVSYFKQTLISIMIGIVLGCGIVFVIYYFDRTIKTKEQVEKLGLPVLGTVQEYKKAGK